jgi:NADPH:quinone reductase-like Zn-dependent oxidoreductase
MEALVKLTDRPGDVGVIDRPAPTPPAGHVLVRTEAVGLCGSDVHAWRGDKGYECATAIPRSGSAVQTLAPRPNRVSLAIRTTSSSPSAAMTVATGPKISSP